MEYLRDRQSCMGSTVRLGFDEESKKISVSLSDSEYSLFASIDLTDPEQRRDFREFVRSLLTSLGE